MDEVRERDVEVKGLSLIDVCSEDDSLISQSSENLQEHRIFEFPDAVDASKVEDSVDIIAQRDQVSQPSESLELERTQKTGKCNLRKSLAWDSAFFTSAGVLEPEELSSMIEGVDRGGKHSLPRIQEDDLHRSTDSISTMESDSLTLESLEADLFEDVRASIQKSRIRSNVTHSKNSKAGTGEMEGRTIHSSRKVDVASQNKPKAATGMQGSGKMIKQGPVRPQVTKPVASGRESISSLPRLPKIISRANPISTASTKRASLGANSLRMEKDSAKSSIGRGAPGSKITGLGESHGFVPRPTQPSKSLSKRSLPAAKTEPTTSSSSFDSSGSAPDNISKSSTNTIRRKFDSRTSNLPSSGSTLKTPTRTAVRNKAVSANSHVSSYLMSTTKLCSSISPASSISEWSTESSSSTSTVNQRSSNSGASLGTSSPCKGVCEDSNVSQTVGPPNHVTGLLSQSVKKSATGTGTLHHPASTKPTGLRMPSPKIGFFDGVKSMVRTPKGSMQSHSGIPISLPKIGVGFCSPNKGASSQGKQGKFQTVRTVTPIGNIKPNTQQNSSSMKPSSLLPHQEPSNASTKVSSASKSVRNCAGQSPEVQGDMSPKANGGSHLTAEEVTGLGGVDRTKHGPDSGLIADKDGSLGVLKNEMSPETKGAALLKDIKISPVKGDGPNIVYDSTTVELSTTMRIPFAVNNSFCDRDFLPGLTVEMVEKADTSPFLDSTLKENS